MGTCCALFRMAYFSYRFWGRIFPEKKDSGKPSSQKYKGPAVDIHGMGSFCDISGRRFCLLVCERLFFGIGDVFWYLDSKCSCRISTPDSEKIFLCCCDLGSCRLIMVSWFFRTLFIHDRPLLES